MTTEKGSAAALVELMARLRDPKSGCPWDLEQSFATIAPYTIEEAYEVADAIERGNMQDLREELGDLLFQVAFHSRMAEEDGYFDFDDVVHDIVTKMHDRHPHVFGDQPETDATALMGQWERRKDTEREAKGDRDESALAGIAAGLPEWMRSAKLQKRAARTGFEWTEVESILGKLEEELEEVRVEVKRRVIEDNQMALQDEIGDLLFVSLNLARHVGVDAGEALRSANRKFERRFRAMETLAKSRGQRFNELSLSEMDRLWNEVKDLTRAS